MKIISKKIRAVAFVIMLSLGLGATACSTGTDSGETNVEESDGKDRNPNEHNVTSQQPTSTDTAKMDEAYERVEGDKGVQDRDNDGKADK